MIHFIIPLQPITKKNSQQILVNRITGKPFVSPSKKFKEYEKAALWYIPRGNMIDSEVNIKCLFYMETARKVDLTNLLEAVDDILVRARLLADDNFTIVAAHDGSRVFIDRENPRTEIFIESMKKDNIF